MGRLSLNIDINKGVRVDLYIKNPIFTHPTKYDVTVYANRLIAENIIGSDKISVYFERKYNSSHILYFLVQTVNREEYKTIMDNFMSGVSFPMIVGEKEFNNATDYFRRKLIVDNGICY